MITDNRNKVGNNGKYSGDYDKNTNNAIVSSCITKSNSISVLKNDKTVSSNTRSDRLFGVLPKNAIVSETLISNENFDKPLERRFDWFTFVATGIDESSFADVLNKIIIGEFWGKESEISSQYYDAEKKLFRGGKSYTELWVNDLGIRLVSVKRQYDDESEVEVVDCLLSISGSVLSSLYESNNIKSPLSLVKYLYQSGFHVSRGDMAVTTYDLDLLPNIRQAVAQGNCVGFRYGEYVESWGKKRKSKNKSEDRLLMIAENLGMFKDEDDDNRIGLTGCTLYLGSRESEEFTRCYHEYEKHENRAVRYEKEFKQDKARKAIKILLDAYDENASNDELIDIFDGILIGNHRFIDRSRMKANGSIKYCPNLPFWDKFLDSLRNSREVDMVIKRSKPTLHTSVKWLNRQVKSLFRTLVDGLGAVTASNLVNLMCTLDREKEKPSCIQRDQNLRIKSLQKQGIHAIFTDDELQYIYNQYGIDFGQGYYDIASRASDPVSDKRILKGMLKKNESNGGIAGINKIRLYDESNNPMVHNTYFKEYGNSTNYNALSSGEGWFVLNWLHQNIPSAFEQVMSKLKVNEVELIRESFV